MGNGFVLTLIRHLPTAGNRKRQYIGWTDESIEPVDGKKVQLPWYPKVVYGSDLKRCIESARLYFPQAIYKCDARLRESFFGEWEGKTYDMLKGYRQYRDWIDNPEEEKPPNGESLQDVEARVLAALADLPIIENELFIVTHGGPIRLLLTKFSPELRTFWSWQIPNQSVWRLEWESVAAFKEGRRCVSLSEVRITEKKRT